MSTPITMTPGPWDAETHHRHHIISITADEGREEICTLTWSPKSEADGRAIAAVPEMLSLIRDLLKLAPSEGDALVAGDLFPLARKIIDKVEGRQP